MENQHHRRVHYTGKYPRHYEEKYKELNPDIYRDEAAKVEAKGSTPAGTHIPIMAEEILQFLDIHPGQIGYDATCGYGGHSEKMLQKLNGHGHLYATDVDPAEGAKTLARLRSLGFSEDIFTLKILNFARAREVAPGQKYDFVLADLGVSSMQIDNPRRGFSFREDGPLDLRMNQTSGQTGAERLSSMEEEEIAGMFRENADEPYAEQIASAVYKAIRINRAPQTTQQFHSIIEETVLSQKDIRNLPVEERRQAVRKSSQRCFQALRIDVNSEFEALEAFLNLLPDITHPGSRIAVLTFHSGEDRIVKHAFKDGLRGGIYSEVAGDVIRPSREECYRNPRARSTKLRWAVRA